MFRPLAIHRSRRPDPRRFRQDEGGAVIILGVLFFVAMLMVVGVAVDMMRYENERVRVQGAADRAVLAATMLRDNDQGLTPEDIVRIYFEAEGLGHILPEDAITIVPTETGRRVTIEPQARFSTTFLRWHDVNARSLEMPILSEAVEGIATVTLEIVLVLDVSGSMMDFNRMENLRAAAIDFVNDVLADNDDGRVAVTIVPYSTEVILPASTLNFFTNLGPPLSGNWTNAFCIDFATWTSVTDSINTPMFRRNCDLNSNTSYLITGMPVRPYFHRASDAVAYINTLGPNWGTSIDLGLRVGAMFFDPSIRPIISHLISNNEIDPVFDGRPLDWNAPASYRALVLMTDGENCCFHIGHPATRKPTVEIQDADTVAICNALKAEGVIIYGVAFEAPPGGEALMAACASSAGHYFNSSGQGVINAFRQIATHIQTQRLRLVR